MNRILVIGGSGFVGTRLIQLLGESRCINLDKRNSEDFPGITTISDIRDKAVSRCFSEDIEAIILLAAEHRDDVTPVSLYYEVNVEGTRNILDGMDAKGIRKIVFTSSVAVYGMNKDYPDENHPADPFNHYGKSKWQAEEILRSWYLKDPENRSLTIIRPSVIFGERNRGNVYNLLNQIASKKFLMVGDGLNKKSMAYVGNVVAFIKICIGDSGPGYKVYNYVDTPDLSMNELVEQVEISLGKKIPSIRIPYHIGYVAGLSFDVLSNITGRKFPVSSIRVKKFCSATQFNASAVHSNGFRPPFTLTEGLNRTLKYEFLNPDKKESVFMTE